MSWLARYRARQSYLSQLSTVSTTSKVSSEQRLSSCQWLFDDPGERAAIQAEPPLPAAGTAARLLLEQENARYVAGLLGGYRRHRRGGPSEAPPGAVELEDIARDEVGDTGITPPREPGDAD